MKRNSLSGSGLTDVLQTIAMDFAAIRLVAAKDDASIADDMLFSMLSGSEQSRAQHVSDVGERRHFMFRRCMQRLFVAQTIGWTHDLKDIDLRHGVDQRPICAAAPHLCLSFSSSTSLYVFAAAEKCELGVDIERLRPVENVVALANRFFSVEEAQAVADCPQADQSRFFLTIWSAKEAGLKAKGRGIDSGLNSFTLENRSGQWHIGDHDAPDLRDQWQLFLPQWREDHIVAVMHRSAV